MDLPNAKLKGRALRTPGEQAIGILGFLLSGPSEQFSHNSGSHVRMGPAHTLFGKSHSCEEAGARVKGRCPLDPSPLSTLEPQEPRHLVAAQILP